MATELYEFAKNPQTTYNGWIVWCEDYTSVKSLKKKQTPGPLSQLSEPIAKGM